MRRLFQLVLLAFVAGSLSLFGLFSYYAQDLPSVQELRSYNPPQTTRVLDRNGVVIGTLFEERRTVVPMERIPRVLVLSILAAEDADFYRHKGMDYPGILRAVILEPLSGRRPQGASTITQQVVKTLLLSPERSIKRKIRELILARRLEQEFTKDEIIHFYLNHINFGHGRYGVQEAAQYYFSKDVDHLSLAESSLIAGLPQAPTRLSPRRHPEAARRRQLFVLSQLESKRREYWPDLSVAEIEAARQTEIPLVSGRAEGLEAAEVLTLVRQQLRELVGEEAYSLGGYTIQTTLDIGLQRKARMALLTGLTELDARQGYQAPLRRPTRSRSSKRLTQLQYGRSYIAKVVASDDEHGTLSVDVGGLPALVDLSQHERFNPEQLPPSRFAAQGAHLRVSLAHLGEPARGLPATVRLELGPEGAVVLMSARSREVLALIGSAQASPGGFNRATRSVRQPGSTFKPLVYALGIKTRMFTPATRVIDAPAVYDEWRPSNYETWRFEGDVSLRVALARSINMVAVRVIEKLKPESVVSFARELGIRSSLEPSLSLSLGASDVSLMELTNAYTTFAAGGRFARPRFIRSIRDSSGEIVPIRDDQAPRDVLSPAEAFVVTTLLRSVVEQGTARAARRLGYPIAGKTGTSNEARDAWFVGYSPELVAGVWVGFDDRRSLGRRESGGRSALPIWIEVMAAGLEGRPRLEFRMPSGVVTRRVDPDSGLLAHEEQEDAVEEVFLEGTEPTSFAPEEEIADSSTLLMEQFRISHETEER